MSTQYTAAVTGLFCALLAVAAVIVFLKFTGTGEGA